MEEELNKDIIPGNETIASGSISPVGTKIYGETFQGFMKIGEMRDLIPLFKEFYYECKIQNIKKSNTAIIREFNDKVAAKMGRRMHPYPNQSRLWFKKWEKDILEKKSGERFEIVDGQKKEIQIVSKAQNDTAARAPDENELEMGIRTLGGELLNDAMQMLKADQMFEEGYDDEMIVKRRNYVVNVFSHVTKMVHGKAALMLKASEEKRNSTGFLMELMRKATSGNLTEAELELLGSNYSAPQETEQTT